MYFIRDREDYLFLIVEGGKYSIEYVLSPWAQFGGHIDALTFKQMFAFAKGNFANRIKYVIVLFIVAGKILTGVIVYFIGTQGSDQVYIFGIASRCYFYIRLPGKLREG